MGRFDTIYERSPLVVQQLGVAAFGLWWKHRRFGGSFPAMVEEIAARDRFSPEQFKLYQRRALGDVLRAARRSPFWRARFDEAGVREGDDPLEALAKLPLLTKQELREHGRELLTQAPDKDVLVLRSSGTTGTPTEVFFARSFHRRVQAYFEARNRRWAGVRYDDKRAMFGVRKVCRQDQDRPPFWRKSPAERLAYFSIYHLSPAYMPAYIEYLNTFQPKVIMGYPNSLVTLAKFSLENDLPLAPAQAVITTSETVTTPIREAVEQAWGCKIWDQYCAVEGCMLFTQCEVGSYHQSPDFGVFEIIDDDGNPCPPGQVGRAVCTGLLNTLQPLLRYEIGDAVAWEEGPCACGRTTPLLRSIEGRVEDMCYLADGRALLRFDTVFKGVSTIREGQVVQEELDRFVLRIVPTPGFSDEDSRRLIENMRVHAGDVHTTVERVAAIERTKAGKFRPVISKVKPPRARS